MNSSPDVVRRARVRRQLEYPSVTPLDQATESMNWAGVESSGENRSTEREADNGADDRHDPSWRPSPGVLLDFAHCDQNARSGALCRTQEAHRMSTGRGALERRVGDGSRPLGTGGRERLARTSSLVAPPG